MSSRSHRERYAEGRPLIFAHRGARCELPENTLPAFERALALGADVLEMDVHQTKDGLVVVAHDEDGQRMAHEPRAIRGSTFREIARWDVSRGFHGAALRGPFRVPTFEEVLATFPRARLNVDLKARGPGLVRSVLRLVREYGAEDRVRLASFSDVTLARLRAEGYGGETSFGKREVLSFLFLAGRIPSAILRFRGARAQIPVRYGPLHFGTRRLVERAHALGVSIDYWTVNEPNVAARLAALGADGIVTDDVRAVVGAVRR